MGMFWSRVRLSLKVRRREWAGSLKSGGIDTKGESINGLILVR